MRGTLTLQNSKTSSRIHGNSTQLCRTDEVKGSAESGGRAGADAAEIESLSQKSEALLAEKCFLVEKPLNWPNFHNRKSD